MNFSSPEKFQYPQIQVGCGYRASTAMHFIAPFSHIAARLRRFVKDFHFSKKSTTVTVACMIDALRYHAQNASRLKLKVQFERASKILASTGSLFAS